MADENVFTWRGKLPEEMNTNPALEPYKDDAEGFVNLAKSYISQQKLIGADKIPLPGKNATEEEIAEFWKKLGAPGKDGYELTGPETPPEGFRIPDGLDDIVKDAAAKVHAPKGVAEAIWKAIVGDMAKRFGDGKSARETDYSQRLEAFHQSLGAAKDERLKAINQAVFALTGDDPDTLSWLQKTGLLQEPRMMGLFMKMSGLMKEDKAPPSGGGGEVLTPAEAQAKIARLTEKPEYMTNKTIQDEVNALYKLAYPEKSS